MTTTRTTLQDITTLARNLGWTVTGTTLTRTNRFGDTDRFVLCLAGGSGALMPSGSFMSSKMYGSRHIPNYKFVLDILPTMEQWQ